MPDPVVLVTAICGDIGCSASRALMPSVYRIIGCDAKPLSEAWYGDLVDVFEIVPPAKEKSAYIKSINHIIHKYGVDYFLPISEPEIELVNRHKREFTIDPNRILINNPLIVETFLDKQTTIQFLKEIGITVPESIPLSQFTNQFNFPLMVKSRRGCGSKRNWKVCNKKELSKLRATGENELIVQQYIGSSDEEYTTGVFSDGIATAAISFKRKLGYGGLSVEVKFENIPFLDHLAEFIALKTGLRGSLNIQSRREGEIYIPFEINPRLSSTLLFRKKFGFDDAVWWMNLLNDKPFEYRRKFACGSAIRYLSEKYYNMQEL